MIYKTFINYVLRVKMRNLRGKYTSNFNIKYDCLNSNFFF
jgi:hypothetical protein